MWKEKKEINGKKYKTYDFVHNFFMCETELLKKARWEEKIKIYAEHLHFFLVNKDILKVTKCNVSVGHEHTNDTLLYKQQRNRNEYIEISNNLLGVTDRKVYNRKQDYIHILDKKDEPILDKPSYIRYNRLFGKKRFSDIFSEWQGKRVGYVRNPGNAGDDMIYAATVQLFTEYAINWIEWDGTQKVDVILFGGGGSMGGYYSAFLKRKKCLSSNIPVVILPQSWMSEEDKPYIRLWCRERDSLQFAGENAKLAPDLALGLRWHNEQEIIHESGVFLRKDAEGLFKNIPCDGDPIEMAKNHSDYLKLAASYGKIVTDRLHFAIAGLICGRKVTLLPNSYHKNKSMWETWLKDLGCEWSDVPLKKII
jgi:exopolysaccharide biosynthesis predicted pyruvyltransferase EpsI